MNFIPLDDKILDSDKPITKAELNAIEHAITQSSQILDMCGDNDDDVRAWHDKYLGRIIRRLERSLEVKTRPRLRLIRS